jgi:hypothetical protein
VSTLREVPVLLVHNYQSSFTLLSSLGRLSYFLRFILKNTRTNIIFDFQLEKYKIAAINSSLGVPFSLHSITAADCARSYWFPTSAWPRELVLLCSRLNEQKLETIVYSTLHACSCGCYFLGVFILHSVEIF